MKLNVAVFFGGKTCEHEISCITASQVLNAIDREKYNVTPIYMSKNNDFFIGEELENLKNYHNLDSLINKLTRIYLLKENNKVLVKPVKQSIFKKNYISIDVCFLANHGTSGEDGCLQGYLELLDLPYTSSGVCASAIAQDKVIQRYILSANNIPVVKGYGLDYFEYSENAEEFLKKNCEIGYPLILKPSNLGSSIGIEVAKDEKEFKTKIKEVSKYDYKIVVEKYLSSFREINCSVKGNIKKCHAATLEEVIKDGDILDFNSKYCNSDNKNKTNLKTGQKFGLKQAGMSNAKRKIPADVTKQEEEMIKNYAKKAYKLLGASGVVRIDFINDLNTNEFFVEELNNIPGSLAFYLWDKENIPFNELINQMIDDCLKEYRLKASMQRSFDTNILANF